VGGLGKYILYNIDWMLTEEREREQGLADQKLQIGLRFETMEWQKMRTEVSFLPCFSIASDKQPVQAIN
jgi:hypothetical protein